MVKFSNEKSEQLYNELMEAHKDELRSNSNHVKRYPISKKHGVNRLLFILAEYTAGSFLKFRNNSKNRQSNIKVITNLESNYEELYSIYINISSRTIKLLLDKASVKEPEEVKEKPVKQSVSNTRVSDLKKSISKIVSGFIGTVGILEVEKTMNELLDELAVEKSKHLDALYGAGK